MSARVDRLRERLEEPLLVTGATNVRYLTGFASSNAALLVEPDRVRLFSDFRYAEAARAVEGVEFVEVGRDLLGDLGGRLSGRIGFESAALSYAGWQKLGTGGIELVPRTGTVEAVRAVKGEDELAAIRRSAEIANEAYARLARERFVGRTELELAWRMRELFHELGADGAAFPTIVGAGPNGARPHAVPGERTIERGQTVVVDAGCRVDGYCSDCTRTFSTGDLPAELADAYGTCLDAQRRSLAAVRAGAAARAVDAVARERIAEDGLAETFGHGLGHGVGLDVHEAPTLNGRSDETLEAGNVVTIEPGVYLEGRGGIRIEDLAIVTGGEPEVLTPFTKELVEVG